MTDDELFEKVTKLMLSFKIQPQVQGFDFIRSAVLYYLKENKRCSKLTTEVYPILAKQYNTKEASIERNIRKCIENAYDAGGLLSINTYYGAIVYDNKFRFSNSELISIIIEIVRLDELRRKFCSEYELQKNKA